MFNWFRKPQSPSPPPKICEANPGRGYKFNIAFANGERNWVENVDLVDCMAEALASKNQRFVKRSEWLELEPGLIIQPQIVPPVTPLDDGGAKTITTVEVSSPDVIPRGVFEFQHSAGDSTRQSIIKGFKSWADTDLPVYLDVFNKVPAECKLMEMSIPATSTEPARTRHILFGPTYHFAKNPSPVENEEHPFCPCCLFTSLGDAAKERLADRRFIGIRFYAMRDADGEASADCRVNGVDWAEGKEALIRYVAKWPDRGFEFRKQYVVIHG